MYTNTHARTLIHTRTHTHTHTHTHTYTYTHTQTHAHAHAHTDDIHYTYTYTRTHGDPNRWQSAGAKTSHFSVAISGSYCTPTRKRRTD